jgi:hypothetical protein
MAFVAQNPVDGSLIQTRPEASSQEVTAAIRLAHEAHLLWREKTFSHGRGSPGGTPGQGGPEEGQHKWGELREQVLRGVAAGAAVFTPGH